MNLTTTTSALVTAAPDDCGMDEDRLARITPYFADYLDAKKLPNLSTLIYRRGAVCYHEMAGGLSLDPGSAPISPDTIYRLYSMTKPVASVVAMMLYEEGRLQLSDPVSKYLPAFAAQQVYAGGTPAAPVTTPPRRPVTIRDLMTHTAGFSYSFLEQHPVDQIYRNLGLDTFTWKDDLAAFADQVAAVPLQFSPGERWCYSVATDILGRVIEVIEGRTLDHVFEARVFAPLGMVDTGFHVPPEKADRLAANYVREAETGALQEYDPAGAGSSFTKVPALLSAGGGLVSTFADYLKFCRMLLGGGILDGVRLLSPMTVDYMSKNHLPGGRTISEMGDQTFSETRMEGAGFGLGFTTTTDPVMQQQVGSAGSLSWGGMASTFFWIDPAQDMIVIQMTQAMPSSAFSIRPRLQQLVYAAITD